MSFDEADASAREASDDALERGARCCRRLTLWSTAALAGTFLLGVWADWRWLPSMIIPFTLLWLSAESEQTFTRELRRRGRRDDYQ